MKRLVLTLSLSIVLNQLQGQTTEKTKPYFSLYDAGVFDGRTYYQGFSLGNPNTYGGMLDANSQVLTVNINNMYDISNTYADWTSNSNNYSLGGFATFRLHTKPTAKARHLFSVGINYLQGGVVFKNFAEFTPTRIDSVLGPNQETYAYIDSVDTHEFNFTHEHNKLLFNFDYQIATNPKTKLGVSIGFGLGIGFTVVNLYEASASYGYRKYMVDPNSFPASFSAYPYYSMLGAFIVGGQNNNQFIEAGNTRSAFVLRPYVPVTLSYRLSNKSKFLRRVSVFAMFRVGREFMAWGKGTSATSLFHERSIGIRYLIALPEVL